MMIFGLGSGRSGTNSLAYLLAQQKNAIIFHEMNPSAMCFEGTSAPVHNTVREFAAILSGGDKSLLTIDQSRPPSIATYEQLKISEEVSLIGDVALYYLNYVEEIMSLTSNARFICMQRDRSKTIDSFLRKTQLHRWPSQRLAAALTALITREPHVTSSNHWMEHDGTKWAKDLLWDKCFPKFDVSSKEEAVAHYYDYYYEKAEHIAGKYPDIFQIVPLDQLNDDEGQARLLDFCGIARSDQVTGEAWVNQVPGG